MKAPRFWQTGGLPAWLLAPLGPVTASITARRVARPGWRAPVPVLCVGNATVGGTGKTPLVLDLAARLLARGVAVHVLTRGYGGFGAGPLHVDPEIHEAAVVGEEALLLAAVAPCWVGADRAASARQAVAAGAAALLMDDGLQNPTLIKDTSLMTIDGAAGFGNGFLLPAGPLREPIAAAASRCQAAILIGEDRTCATAHLPPRFPVLHARLVPGADMLAMARQPVLAFAGMGRPEKFFATLRECSIVLAETRTFADHHRYSPVELASLRDRAASLGATLVTTTKDFARLPLPDRPGIVPLSAILSWTDDAPIELLLARLLP